MLNKLKSINWFWVVFMICAATMSHSSENKVTEYAWLAVFCYGGLMYELSVIKSKIENLTNTLGELLRAIQKRVSK